MNVTGSIYVDLTNVHEDRARMSVYRAISAAPPHAHVVLYVGPLSVNPAVVSTARDAGQHVSIEVSGHGYTLAHWVEALRHGLGAIT